MHALVVLDVLVALIAIIIMLWHVVCGVMILVCFG